MSHQLASDEISFAPNHGGDDVIKKVKKVTIILSVITIIELIFGLVMYKMGGGSSFTIMLIKGVVVILSLAKAFYITAYFMHLADEIKGMMMTIVIPLALFIWFIIAFLYEGNSWKNMKNTDAGSRIYIEQKDPPAVNPGSEH